jgi:hypothetical protein
VPSFSRKFVMPVARNEWGEYPCHHPLAIRTELRGIDPPSCFMGSLIALPVAASRSGAAPTDSCASRYNFFSLDKKPPWRDSNPCYLSLKPGFAPLLPNTLISGFATLRSDRVYGPPISICELFHVDLPSFDNKLQRRFIGRHSE